MSNGLLEIACIYKFLFMQIIQIDKQKIYFKPPKLNIVHDVPASLQD